MARQPQLVGPGEACKAPSQLVWGEAEVPLPQGDNKIDIVWCYSTKDWVERRKRKQLVKRELNNINPTLSLNNADGELIHVKWKAFKRARNITSSSMNVLLKRPGETYFAEAKQLKSKNKTCT